MMSAYYAEKLRRLLAMGLAKFSAIHSEKVTAFDIAWRLVAFGLYVALVVAHSASEVAR
jgi:hypothetical protein